MKKGMRRNQRNSAIKGMISLLLAVGLAGQGLAAVGAEEATAPSNTAAAVSVPDNLLTDAEEIAAGAENVSPDAAFSGEILSAEESSGYGASVVSLGSNGEVTFEVEVPEAGGYLLRLDYFIPESYMRDLLLSVEVNGEYPFYESRNLEFKAVWKDTTQEYSVDTYGDEMYPLPERVYRWQQDYAGSVTYDTTIPYVFELEEGRNTITIANNEVPVMIGEIAFTGLDEVPSYSAYREAFAGETAAQAEPIVVEGEHYTEKSDSYIRPERGSNVAYVPYDASKKLINSLAGTSAAEPNQWVTYTFTIDEPGLYHIAFKQMQSEKSNMPAYKRILIDGEVPFAELQNYPFPYTGNKLQNEVISVNGEEAAFYFEAGEHTITLESTADVYAESYENLMAVLNDCSQIALEVQYVTGNKSDKNRDWKIERYIPDLKDRLLEGADILTEEYEKLNTLATVENPAMITDLRVAADRLRSFAEDLNDFVNNIESFSSGNNSVNSLISGVLPNLLSQPVTIDRIYITPDTAEIPSAKVSLWTTLVEEVKKLFLSYGSETETAADGSEKEILDVWVYHATTNVEVQRQLTDSSFLPDKDYGVKLSMSTDEQKLLMAVAAGSAPDAVIGLSYYMPFQLALRGALYDLTQFEDFGGVVDDYNPNCFLPFTIEDSCYALPEALNFNLLYYRTDILNQLGLEVPETWDDVIEMLPTLSQYGMSFASQIGQNGSQKTLGSTWPFFEQMGASIYTDDGLRMALGSTESIEAFTLMTDLYTKYSLPSTVANFYNSFVKGTTPIGIGDMTTYILLSHAAPEIAGQWGIAPVIGIRDEEGNIHNNMWAVNTANVILKDSDMVEEAWEYIKWFMSDEVQTSYVNNMQMTFGSEFIWASANLDAFANTTAYPQEHMSVILDQLENIAEIPLHPAFLIAQREISDAWNNVVFEGMAPRTALDKAITRTNREITKKLREFGYIDEDGNVLKPYTMPTVETVLSWKE